MNRRDFLAFVSVACSARAYSKTQDALPPASLDLRESIRLAVTCMINRMDPEAHFRPWFAVDVEGQRPTRLRHDVWDFGDTGGRFLEAFILAREMMGPSPEMLTAEHRIRQFVNSLIGSEGVIHNPEHDAPDHMFSQGSALYGLVTDFEASPNPILRARIEKFISALDRLAVHEGDYLWFPQVATKIAPCSHMAAYQVLPIVRFYELTRHASALKYAERLSRWAFYQDPTVTSQGVITKTFWEGHLHAWMDTFSGIIRCARAGGALDRAAVIDRSRKLYEWVKTNYTSSFGWVADSVGSKTCETDTITSAIRLALELIKEGHAEYWNDIERFVRNQLVENQFRDVGVLEIRDPRTARGLQGAFESYAAPNTLVAIEKGTIEGCCINGGVRGLFLAYQNAIQETAEEIRINLLLSSGIPNLEVASHLPFEGRLDLYPRSTKVLLVRYPDWLPPEEVKIDGPGALRVEPEPQKPYLRIVGAKPGSRVVLRFDQPDGERTHIVAGNAYRARWRGDVVLGMSPPGKPYPIFQRQSLFRSEAPLAIRNTAYRQPRVHW